MPRRSTEVDSIARPSQSVRRALLLLRSFKRDRAEVGINELAREHGLNPSSVSRLMGTLAEQGFVRLNRETGRYRLGFAPLELAGLLLLHLDIRAAAQPAMRELALASGETVNLALLEGHEAVIVEQALAPSTFRFVSWIGRRIPLHATAHGKVHLAFSSAEDRAQILDLIADHDGNLPRYTPATIGTRAVLEAEINLVVARGYATAHGELDQERSGVAVPIFDYRGELAASLAVPGLSYRNTPERVETLVRLATEASQHISRELGWDANCKFVQPPGFRSNTAAMSAERLLPVPSDQDDVR